MLAVHALWDCHESGALLVWAEDSELPASCPPLRGRRPAVPRARAHPFAAPVASIVAGVAGTGSVLARSALDGGAELDAILWLPGTPEGPHASSQLIRAEPEPEDPPARGKAGRENGAPGLWPFTVPALRLSPGPALDLLLALADCHTPELHPGASVTVLAAVGGLALEMVAGGRALPDLVVDGGGRHLARWVGVGGGADEDRVLQLGASLPPVCRSLGLDPSGPPGQAGALGSGPDRSAAGPRKTAPAPSAQSARRAQKAGPAPAGADPVAIVRDALDAFVDAVCRDSLRRARRSLVPGSRSRPERTPPVVEAWLASLASEAPEVVADTGELAKLERLVAEWRSGAAGRVGPWRLCFRLCEPDAGDRDSEGEPAYGVGGDGADGSDARAGEGEDRAATAPWRVELLLQATDDLSLLVDAAEVWRSGATLRSAARTLQAPHETLLAELGRAVRAYPELSRALREAAPTGLETDLAGAHRFLSEVAPALEVAGFGVLLPAWWRRPSSRLGVRLRATGHGQREGGTGLLTQDGLCAFDWQAALGDQQVGMAELRRLAKLKAPLVQVRGKWMELRPGEVDKLVKFLDSGRRSTERTMTVAEVLRVAAGAEELTAGVPVVGVEADGLLGALLRGELEESLEVRGTPEGFAGQLRPYQERGVAWLDLLERTGLGACLADDMGLGKTAMVLALLQAEHRLAASPPPARRSSSRAKAGVTARGKPASAARGKPASTARGKSAEGNGDALGPTLVVCPTSVVGNWQREAEHFTPDLRVHVHHGATRARAEAFAAEAAAADVVITSYALVDRDRTALAGVQWSRIVLDEAQNVKNPDTKQTKAVRALRSPRRIALTGTPVENHLGELWSIMEILNPGLLGSASAFREHFAVPIERYREEDAAERLRTITRPFVLRRLKTDRTIITDLPDKMEMKVLCNLTREQATLYQAVVDEMLRRIEETDGIERKGLVLATMLRLKQVCNHPAQYLGDGSALGSRSGKLERTVEILEEVSERGEKALVFTQFAEMGTMLRDHLQQRLGARVAFLHGGVPRRQRDAMVQEFQGEDSEVPVMVLSLKAGGTGLNLTAANHVVHFDRWWNPAVENQATDRAFRIGQRRDVQVRKLICAGTLEDRIDQMIEAKRDLAERIVGAGESWLTELSTDELAAVFRLSAEIVSVG